MKLRIEGNSIRLRLLQSEVKRLSAAGTISEDVIFGVRPDQVLRYAITVSAGVDVMEVEFSDSQILIMIPETTALEWFTSDLMSIEREIEIDEESRLSVLIEKDLVCVERPDDPDNADAYPHPKMSC